ncbi:MAG TPA: tRNA 2-selenouridine(34) synthase MnmH [Bacteroidia bacterium]
MIKVLPYSEFETLSDIIIDVRSQGEFNEGHIPGAVNLPLLNDEHRIIVGTTYKKQGKYAAMQTGYDLVNPIKSKLIEELMQLKGASRQVRVYCARGGLRSRLMSEFFEENGVDVIMLKGGYKFYRRHILSRIDGFKKLRVLSGFTGSGKTEILQALRQMGEQVLDLEDLAKHKGSAFGNLEGVEQPITAYFHNLIDLQLRHFDANKYTWIESESFNIGKVHLPAELWENMKIAQKVEVEIPLENRVKNILNQYGKIDKHLLVSGISVLRKRLGDEDFRQLSEWVLEGNLEPVVFRLLKYYDRGYENGRKRRDCQEFVKFVFDHSDPFKIAEFLMKELKGSDSL